MNYKGITAADSGNARLSGKIPERSEDDFFLSSQALQGSLAAKGRQSKTFAA